MLGQRLSLQVVGGDESLFIHITNCQHYQLLVVAVTCVAFARDILLILYSANLRSVNLKLLRKTPYHKTMYSEYFWCVSKQL